jgi:hypothetical protein
LKQFLLILVFITLSFSVWAQSTKSIQLKPIFKNGKRYFYDSKRVNSAHALQIPLEALKDDEINKHFNRFKIFQRVRGLAYLPALIYMIYTPINTNSQANTFLGLVAGGVVADITLNNVGHYQMNKAIDLYNIGIMQRGAIGLRLEKSNGDRALCIGFQIRL